MPVVVTEKALETTKLFRRKTVYRTGAGRLQWGEGMAIVQEEEKHKRKSFYKRKSKSFRVNSNYTE